MLSKGLFFGSGLINEINNGAVVLILPHFFLHFFKFKNMTRKYWIQTFVILTPTIQADSIDGWIITFYFVFQLLLKKAKLAR